MPVPDPPIPMSSPDLDESDVAAVVEVLRSGRLALGPTTAAFEREIADYVQVPHAVAVSSGTAALTIALEAVGVVPGDEVLVPSFTFSASVSVIFQAGATPVFVDILPDVFTLDPADLEAKLSPRSRAVMAVDVFGHPVEWNELNRIAERAGLRVVDDSCEAIGAEYHGRKLGGFGDVAAFAFYPNKQMTTGEGGVLVTADGAIADLARSLRNQGRDAVGGAWLEHPRLGFNYRLDEMSAALGRSQLRRIETFLDRRARVAERYTRRLQGIAGVEPPTVHPDVRMSWFVYVVRLAEGLPRERAMAHLERRGIATRAYFSPIHLQPYVRDRLGDLAGTLPVTEAIASRTIALPFHNQLADEEIERVAAALEEALQLAG